MKAQKLVSFVPQYVLVIVGQLLFKGNVQLINNLVQPQFNIKQAVNYS